MGRRRRQRGFTLVELVVVVAIIAVLGTVTAYTLLQGRRRLTLERANLTLKGLLEQARSLSAVAGSRAGTNRLQYGAGCTDAAALAPGDPTRWQLWVRFTGTQVEVPSRLQDNGNDTLLVTCETFDLNVATNGLGQFAPPVPAGEIAFSPSGRVILAGIPGPPAYIQMFNPADTLRYGLRVLPSGVVCESSVAAGPPWCDENP